MFLICLFQKAKNLIFVIFLSGKVSQLGSPHFTFLGLGDIIIPGLLLCFVLRYDNYKRKMLEESENPQNFIHKIRYFYCILFGYFVGNAVFAIDHALIYLYLYLLHLH